MRFQQEKNGYGYLIKWVIGFCDLILINISFIILLKLGSYSGLYLYNAKINQTPVFFLLINLSYFITLSIIPQILSSNIVFFDKVIQRSISFITLYFIIISVGLSLFDIAMYDWTSWLFFYTSLTLLYIVYHIILRFFFKYYRSKGYNYKRVVIVGNNPGVFNIYNELNSKDYGYKILETFNDSENIDKTNTIHAKKDLFEIESFCIENNVDEIYCTLNDNKKYRIINLINFCEKNHIKFYLVPEFYGYIHRKLTLHFLQSVPVITICPEPLQLLRNRIIKRIFDLIFSICVLVFIFPLIFIIFGLLIKITSKGPIFFKQERTGLQGNSFFCYKFRSMIVNDTADTQITTRSDSRITRVGRFMRRTSIDEFPQFYNVLLGNMSVVGPRPHMVQQTQIYNRLIDKFMVRHIVKPGITGWAQISGYRGETKTEDQMQDRFRRDMWYIENWSSVLDIKIIIATIYLIFKGDENAY